MTKHMYHTPRFYRDPLSRIFGWEIYDRKAWFFNFAPTKSIEIQINRWPEVKK